MKTKYLKNVVTLQLQEEKCTGCGICIEVCPHNVLALTGNKVRIIDKDSCMECGACAKNCAFGAIGVRSGVGCAAAIIIGKMLGTEPSCGCSDGGSSGCC